MARQGARGENAARMRYVERRRAISVGLGEEHFAVGDHAVHVVDDAGNELLEKIEGLLVAELLQPGPEIVGLMNFFHADAEGLRAGLAQPEGRDVSDEFTY